MKSYSYTCPVHRRPYMHSDPSAPWLEILIIRLSCEETAA